MTAVIQRVKSSDVAVDGEVIAKIGRGLNVLLGISGDDGDDDLLYLCDKIANLRIFEDADGKLNLSLFDLDYEILLISQFTLLGDCSRGRRPSFIKAARPEKAAPMCEQFAVRLRELGVKRVATGVFGADMTVNIVNDGPVTIIMDSIQMRGKKA